MSLLRYLQRPVQGWYENLLHRPADASSLIHFTDSLRRGVAKSTILDVILSSAEDLGMLDAADLDKQQ